MFRNDWPFRGSGARGSGFRVQVSAHPLSAKTYSLVEKETQKKRISKNKYRMSKKGIISILAKKIEHTDTTLRNYVRTAGYFAIRPLATFVQKLTLAYCR
jgi:hypothetical protein